MRNPFTLQNWISLVLRYPKTMIFLAFVMMAALVAGGRPPEANNYRVMLGEDNPQLLALNKLEDTYSSSETALIAVAFRRKTSIFHRQAILAVEELTEAAWRTPYSSRVDSLTNYNHSRAEGDDLIVEPLVGNAMALTDPDLARLRGIALNSPELAGRLVSRDGRVTAIAITFSKPEEIRADAAAQGPQDFAQLLAERFRKPEIQSGQSDMVQRAPDYLNAVLEKARAKYPELEFYLTGDVMLNRATVDAIGDGVKRLIPIAFVIALVGTALLLRSLLSVFAIFVLMLFAVASTMGFAAWSGIVLSPMTSGTPIIIMVLAVAHSVHIITATLLQMRQGLDRKAAIRESMSINAYPVFLASLTTIIGFLSLNTSDSPPIQALGNLAAFGMLCVFVYCMTLLPALLSKLRLRPPQGEARQVRLFAWLGGVVVKWRSPLLWLGLACMVALMAGVPRNHLSDDWTKQFDESYRFRRDTDFVIDNLTGLNSLEYSLDSGSEGGVTGIAYLRQVEAFADWAAAQPEVLHVRSFADIMKKLNRSMHGDDPEFYRLPDGAELAAQYLLLYELSIPFGGDLNDRIDIAKQSTRMTLTVRDIPANELRALDRRAQEWLQANAPELTGEASGITMIFAHLTQRNIESMLLGTIIGMGLISLLLIAVFRSLRLGLVSLVPNFIPPALGFGLWGYLVGQISLTASITTIIAFGIIVDDTIHFMSKYLKGRRDGMTAADATRFSFRTVGPALLTTTLVLAAGFGVFSLSGYEGIWVLGQMVTLIVVFGLIVDFLFLPPLLMRIDKNKRNTPSRRQSS